MEDVRRNFLVHMKEVFREDLNEFVNNDSKLVDRCLMGLLIQVMY